MKTETQFDVLLLKKRVLRKASLLRAAAVTMAMFVWASVISAQGTWTELAPNPFPAEGMAVGSSGEVVIAAYGAFETDFNDTNLSRLYNGNTNTWSLGAAAPLPVRAEVANGELMQGCCLRF
jgi:hypothetical protein